MNKGIKVGVLGANGALGSQLVKVFDNDNKYETIPVYHHKLRIGEGETGYGPQEFLNILDEGGDFVEYYDNPIGIVEEDDSSLDKLFKRHKFDVVINTVAYNNTNVAEDDVDRCFYLNSVVLKQISELCNQHDILLIHISTDFVFGNEPKREHLVGFDEFYRPAPNNIYAISKYAGEQIVLNYCQRKMVIRVSTLFGPIGSSAKGRMNFVYTVLDKMRNGNLPFRATNDHWMIPSYTYDVAETIKKLTDIYYFKLVRDTVTLEGLRHMCNRGDPITWFDFAREIMSYYKNEEFIKENLIPVSKTEFSNVPSSEFTAMRTARVIEIERHWKDALHEFLSTLKL